MYLALHNLYGMKSDRKSWYRKNGDCFDFVNDKSFATDMTPEECKRVKRHEIYYCLQYNASHMTIER